MTSKLTRIERETHLYLNDEENIWYADSYIPRDINKFKKQGWDMIDESFYPDGTIAYARFKAPSFAISIRKPEKRKMSEEQRLAAAERMRMLHKKSV